MRNKKIGVAVWVTGLILMANYSVFIDTQDIRTRVVLTLFIIAFSSIAIYSWLWGRQKGHFAHLIIILLYAFLAIILNVEKYIGILYFTFFIFLYLWEPLETHLFNLRVLSCATQTGAAVP